MSTSSVPGTNVAPVSFPGIASGIDYNSIISKLTSLSMQPTITLNAQIATLNTANTELITINGLLASVQNSLTALSQPDLFNAVSAVSSDPNNTSAQGIPGVYATPGSYTIDSTQLATATVVTANPNVGHSITDVLTSGPDSGMPSDQAPLVNSYAGTTPTNGGGATGQITIDGIAITYDVTSQSLDQILTNITNAVNAGGDAGFSATLVGGVVHFASSDQPISIGSPSDTGNLLDVLRLSTAQVNNTGSSGSITGTADVGGINQAAGFNSPTAASYKTAVTSGSFTINGVQIAVNAATDNLASLLARINASSAGVIASYNSSTGQISLAAKNTGPQSIVLGAGSDTSNFLSASGLTTASGAVTAVGKQASVTLQSPNGSTQTIYSNSNSVTTAIPGVQLNLTAPETSPFQITVSQDSSSLVSALNAFVSTYNAAISEINQATSPPIVATAAYGTAGGASTSTAVGGGVLYGNADVQSIKDELVNLVTAINPSGGAYNSLSTLGLNLTDSFTQLQQSTSGSTSGQISTQTLQGTDGQLQALNVTQLQSALAANPNAVQNLINGASGLVTQIGSYLTGVTGVPTNTANALLGNIPAISLIQGFENANTASIQSIQEQVTQITDNVNMQADIMRQEFVSSEAEIAQLQSLQSQIGSMFGSSSKA